MLLEAEVDEREPGVLDQLVDEVVGDLGVAGELVEVGGDEHKLQLLLRDVGDDDGAWRR